MSDADQDFQPATAASRALFLRLVEATGGASLYRTATGKPVFS